MGLDVLEDYGVSLAPGTVEAHIGNTPLLRLRKITEDLPFGVEVFAKAEYLNPGGSVKDRAALSMILDGERTGKLRPGMTILDATSGNTGIAYAMIGASRGYKVKVCLPKNASPERRKILKAYDVDIVETDPMLSTDGAQLIARELFARHPERFFYPDQYNNDANWLAHYETTAVEIWKQTAGRITHFVAGLGTSGTFVGVSRRLKEYDANTRVISMQPDEPLHGLEGLKHMATAMRPGIYDQKLADYDVTVPTEAAYVMTQRLASEEGVLVGPSSGANVFAAHKLALTMTGPALVVTILCDGGERYLGNI
jgi:cysteine synthase B